MGDEQICQILALLQLLKQVDYLGLYGHIQCGYALIANDELGLYSQSTGNADALTLTTGELVRVAMEHIALQAALLHNAEYVLLHLGVARLEELMRNKTLAYYLAHGHARVKRRIGVLEYNLYILTQNAHFGIVQPAEVNAVVQHGFILPELSIVLILGLDSRHVCFLILKQGIEHIKLFLQSPFPCPVKLRLVQGLANLGLRILEFLVGLNLLGNSLVKGYLAVHIPHLLPDFGNLDICAVLFQQRLRAFPRVVKRGKAAQYLNNVLESGLRFGLKQVLGLMLIERSLLARLFHFRGGRVSLSLLLLISLNHLGRPHQGLCHVFGGKILQRAAVIQGAARSLIV